MYMSICVHDTSHVTWDGKDMVKLDSTAIVNQFSKTQHLSPKIFILFSQLYFRPSCTYRSVKTSGFYHAIKSLNVATREAATKIE